MTTKHTGPARARRLGALARSGLHGPIGAPARSVAHLPAVAPWARPGTPARLLMHDSRVAAADLLEHRRHVRGLGSAPGRALPLADGGSPSSCRTSGSGCRESPSARRFSARPRTPDRPAHSAAASAARPAETRAENFRAAIRVSGTLSKPLKSISASTLGSAAGSSSRRSSVRHRALNGRRRQHRRQFRRAFDETLQNRRTRLCGPACARCGHRHPDGRHLEYHAVHRLVADSPRPSGRAAGSMSVRP